MLPNCPKSCKENANKIFADNNPNCVSWANAGECKNNPGYMLNLCKEACANK
jgi:hypothetical protein